MTEARGVWSVSMFGDLFEHVHIAHPSVSEPVRLLAGAINRYYCLSAVITKVKWLYATKDVVVGRVEIQMLER